MHPRFPTLYLLHDTAVGSGYNDNHNPRPGAHPGSSTAPGSMTFTSALRSVKEATILGVLSRTGDVPALLLLVATPQPSLPPESDRICTTHAL